MRLRPILLAFMALVLVPVAALAISSQQAQMGITILINVTPNPLGYTGSRAASAEPIIARMRLRGASPAVERAFEAQQIHFLPAGAASTTLAQTPNQQKSLRVDAEVTPNPTATLLTSNAPGSTVMVNVEAGVETAFQCVFQVYVDTAQTSWQLKDGLSQNFTDGTATFVGGDVNSNVYPAATAAPPAPPVPSESPIPTSTPYVVYSTDGSVWAILNNTTYSGSKNFCVDLVVNVPIATAGGTYSDNAIYTLYY